MRVETVKSLANRLARETGGGPIAVVMAEDFCGLSDTVSHLRQLGFPQIVLISDDAALLEKSGVETDDYLHALCEFDASLPMVLNQIMPHITGRWIHACYNAEFLFFPQCEHRSILDAIAFSVEERRDSVFGYVIDLYQDQLSLDANVLKQMPTYFDSAGYFGLAPEMADDDAQFRNIYGGLRWRFAEHVPAAKQTINRTLLFKAAADLKLGPDMLFNLPAYNSISCKWHHNMTMVSASFRAAKALGSNPSSKSRISTLKWGLSQQFEWSSRQLLQGGFMEQGQWF